MTGCKIICTQALIKHLLGLLLPSFKSFSTLRKAQLSMVTAHHLSSINLCWTCPEQQSPGVCWVQFLCSKKGTQPLRNILQTEQSRILYSVFHNLKVFYGEAINNAVYCDCLGKCDSNKHLVTDQPQCGEAEHIVFLEVRG